MSRDARLGAFLFEAETNFAENTSTFANRLLVLDAVDASGLEHARVNNPVTTQYGGDYGQPTKSVQGGSFTIRLHAPGHGSAVTGAFAATALETLLGYVHGVLTSCAGTTINTAGATITNLPVAAASGNPAGGIVWTGVRGDGGGDGQPAVISSHAANAMPLLTALPNAPANGAVVYGGGLLHPNETPTSMAVTTIRAQLLTANHCYNVHGCYPTQIVYEGQNPGELLTVAITFAVSRWSDAAPTFPTGTAATAVPIQPNARGSLYVQARGTTTRQTYVCRSFRMTIDIGIRGEAGPGGVGEFQNVVSAHRLKHTVTVEFVVDSGNASAAPTWASRWDSDTTTDYHLLYDLCGAAAGMRKAFYLPNMCFTDRRPVQFNDGGINRERVMLQAKTGLTTTSELTLSSYRIALG
jgi:hypothetical protein